MPNTLHNFVPGSILRPFNTGPFVVLTPPSDPGGLVDTTAATAGGKLVISGSHARNISTDTFSCDLIVPYCLVLTAVANADAWTIDVQGRDQFGEVRQERIIKTAGNVQQSICSGKICWTHIDYMIVFSASTVGNRLRIGFMYGTRAIAGGIDLSTRLSTASNTNGIHRRLPLPFKPKSTSDIEVRFRGAPLAPNSWVDYSPVADAITFTATDAVAGTSWTTIAAIAAGDIAYTIDGYIGIVNSASANTVVTGGWFKNGVAGTPANTVGGVSKVPTVVVYRNPIVNAVPSSYSLTNGGLIPGAKVMPLVGISVGAAQTAVGGVDLDSATFAFIPALGFEPPFALEFECYVRNGALY